MEGTVTQSFSAVGDRPDFRAGKAFCLKFLMIRYPCTLISTLVRQHPRHGSAEKQNSWVGATAWALQVGVLSANIQVLIEGNPYSSLCYSSVASG